MKPKISAGDWAAKQRFPLTASKVKKYSSMRLAEMREAGIQFVEILGCNHPPDECDAYRSIKGQKFEIEFAPLLPLPDCDKKFCKCIHLARS
jgi:hypothetical protein